MKIDEIYSFVYRGMLADTRLDQVGRQRNRRLDALEVQELRRSLNFDLLDQDALIEAQRMSMVYVAIHTLENMMRDVVSKTLHDEFGETWWDEIPEKISKVVEARMTEDEKLRWHSSRGKTKIMYSDFGDLIKIINTHWNLFSDVLISFDWTKQVLTTLEQSRNVVMHGGVLERIDIERIGINIRDLITQIG